MYQLTSGLGGLVSEEDKRRDAETNRVQTTLHHPSSLSRLHFTCSAFGASELTWTVANLGGPTRINPKRDRMFLEECTYLNARKWLWLQSE